MVIEVNGISLHYETRGEGEPLLWLHGFLGAGPDWQYIFKEPPAGYRLIAPDLRGHGASTNPSESFSFRQAALDVLALLRHLKADNVKGGRPQRRRHHAAHMSTADPASIASMVLVSAPPYFPAQARAIQRQASEAMFGARDLELMRSRHTHGESQFQRLLAQSRAFGNTCDDVNFTPPYLSTIAAEALIVFGDRDPLYPVSLAFDLHSAIPRSRLWVVPNGGHAPVFGDAAPRFAETALSFLRGDWSRS